MGWVTQRGPRRCRFLDPERRLFSTHIIFQALVALEPLLSLMSRFGACSARISGDRQTGTHARTYTHTHTHTHDYRNPRECPPRVNNIAASLACSLSGWGHISMDTLPPPPLSRFTRHHLGLPWTAKSCRLSIDQYIPRYTIHHLRLPKLQIL